MQKILFKNIVILTFHWARDFGTWLKVKCMFFAVHTTAFETYVTDVSRSSRSSTWAALSSTVALEGNSQEPDSLPLAGMLCIASLIPEPEGGCLSGLSFGNAE